MIKRPAVLALFCSLLFSLASCVSEETFEKEVAEKERAESRIKELEEALEEEKFGAPNLASDGKRFEKAGDYAQAVSTYKKLIERHPASPEAAECRPDLDRLEELAAWSAAVASEDTTATVAYLTAYPSGPHVAAGRQRYKNLVAAYEDEAYVDATRRNTATAWKSFLDRYPGNSNRAAIREKIIRLEVDDIFSGDHGELPSFESTGYGTYSATSSVSITNGTGYDLEVRYSGPEARFISIPEGGSRSVSLTSGNYRVAATANGLHYAGSENLQGDYRSRFFIRTSTYGGYSSPSYTTPSYSYPSTNY